MCVHGRKCNFLSFKHQKHIQVSESATCMSNLKCSIKIKGLRKFLMFFHQTEDQNYVFHIHDKLNLC